MLVSERPDGELPATHFYSDEGVRWHGTPGAKKNMLGWDIAPFGMYKLINWVQRRYGPAGGIVVTENGMPGRDESSEGAKRDVARTCYIKQYLAQIARAMRDGADVRGYFVWTLIDNFEWAEGFAPRFGLVHVDFATMRRTPKHGAAFYARLCQTHTFTLAAAECNASVPVLHRFKQEAAELRRSINASNDLTAPDAPKRMQKVMLGAARLAVLAEMQARVAPKLPHNDQSPCSRLLAPRSLLTPLRCTHFSPPSHLSSPPRFQHPHPHPSPYRPRRAVTTPSKETSS